MSRKRKYRARNVKQVRVEDVLEKLSGERVVFGVDVAKSKFMGALMNSHREVVKLISWTHPQETPQVLKMLEGLVSEERSVEVVLEPTGSYGDILRSRAHELGARRCRGWWSWVIGP